MPVQTYMGHSAAVSEWKQVSGAYGKDIFFDGHAIRTAIFTGEGVKFSNGHDEVGDDARARRYGHDLREEVSARLWATGVPRVGAGRA